MHATSLQWSLFGLISYLSLHTSSWALYTCMWLLLLLFRSSLPEVFLGNRILKICSKCTGEHLCRSMISICRFATLLKPLLGIGALLYICCIFSEHLFLRTPVEGCFWLLLLCLTVRRARLFTCHRTIICETCNFFCSLRVCV